MSLASGSDLAFTIFPFYDLASGARVPATRAQLSTWLKNNISISDSSIKDFVPNPYVEGAVDLLLEVEAEAATKLDLAETLVFDTKAHRCFVQKKDPINFEEIEISRAQEADLAEMEALMNFAYEREKLWKKGPRTTVEELKELNVKSGVELYCMRAKGLLGTLKLWFTPGTVWFGMLAVWPHLQSKGLGARFIDSINETAKEMGIKSIKCMVADFNVHLFPYYAKKGFTNRLGEKPWTDPELYAPAKFVILEKRLE